MLDEPVPVSRRMMLRSSACGFGSLAFSGLLSRAHANSPSISLQNPLAQQQTMFPPSRKAHHFHLHAGGAEPCGYFRLQTASGKEAWRRA